METKLVFHGIKVEATWYYAARLVFLHLCDFDTAGQTLDFIIDP